MKNLTTIKLKGFYFLNGVFGGFYIQDKNGVDWGIRNTAKEAYDNFKRLTAWNY